VASLGTHDLPPFAAYATGLDVRSRTEEGAVPEAEADAQVAERARWFRAVQTLTGSKSDDGPAEVLPRALAALAGSTARHLLVNVEDLWGETESQNQPGTVTDTNWSLRARHALEDWGSVPGLEETLASLVEARRADAPRAAPASPATRAGNPAGAP
jgi:4-alpha-glucanotransferase